MSDYTPTTEEVRRDYVACKSSPQASMADDDLIPIYVSRNRFDRWLAAHDREVAAKALRGFVEQLQTAESVLALKLDDILNGVGWMDSGDEVAQKIIESVQNGLLKGAGPKSAKWDSLIDKHLNQHEPYRALDIDVCWTVDADCSVCEDGGNIVQGHDGLTCRKCGAYWDMDGTGGIRNGVRE